MRVGCVGVDVWGTKAGRCLFTHQNESDRWGRVRWGGERWQVGEGGGDTGGMRVCTWSVMAAPPPPCLPLPSRRSPPPYPAAPPSIPSGSSTPLPPGSPPPHPVLHFLPPGSPPHPVLHFLPPGSPPHHVRPPLPPTWLREETAQVTPHHPLLAILPLMHHTGSLGRVHHGSLGRVRHG